MTAKELVKLCEVLRRTEAWRDLTTEQQKHRNGGPASAQTAQDRGWLLDVLLERLTAEERHVLSCLFAVKS